MNPTEPTKTGKKWRALEGITLGYPLDQLLDQRIELGLGQKPAKRGIRLPGEEHDLAGTGTIIICGPPGSGKTTLGLQIAVACAERIENNAVSAFISLESSIDEIGTKAEPFGWAKHLREIKHMDDLGEFSTPDTLAKNLHYILARPERVNQDSDAPSTCPAETGKTCAGEHIHEPNVSPCVLLPLLSPRDIVDTEESADAVFWRRFKQMECLLVAAKRLEENRSLNRALFRVAETLLALAWRVMEFPVPTASEKNSGEKPADRVKEREPRVKEWGDRTKKLIGRARELANWIENLIERPKEGADPVEKQETDVNEEKPERSAKPEDVPSGEDAQDPSQKGKNEDVRQRLVMLCVSLSKSTAEKAKQREKISEQDAEVRKMVAEIRGAMQEANSFTDRKEPREPLAADLQEGLENELAGIAETLKKSPEAHAILPVVVVDSLNMFGEGPLKRSHIHQLFRLFKRYDRVGVFLAETGDALPFDSTIADVVIKLTATKEHGYFVRYIEVEKSRYSPHVLGLHPVKTISKPLSEKGTEAESDDEKRQYNTPPLPARIGWWKERGKTDYETAGEPPRLGLVAFPSLHYTVLRTEHSTKATLDETGKPTADQPSGPFVECFPFKAIDAVIPRSLLRASVVRGRPSSVRSQAPGEENKKTEEENEYLRGSTLMIEGDRSTLKTSLALSFLADGLVKKESALLIRLSDTPLLQPKDLENRPPASEMLASERGFSWADVKPVEETPTTRWQNLVSDLKALLACWEWTNPNSEAQKTNSEARLFEFDFKGGNLLPEEFVQFVIDVLIRRTDLDDTTKIIRRVVLDDVSQIDVSYPFLRGSLTGGNLFLPTLVHVLRNFGVDLVMVGTTSGLVEADDAVRRARALADSVVSCRFVDVFGKRQVVVSGGVAGEAEGEFTLPVLRLTGEKGAKRLDLNKEYLEGLVGLETGNPHRPGLILHVFEGDATIQGEYNREMATMLRAGLARPERRRYEAAGAEAARRPDSPGSTEAVDVSVEPFNSQFSEAIHDSLDFLRDRPVDRTVLCTVDEFLGEKASLFLPPRRKGGRAPMPGESLPDEKELILEGYRRGILECAWPYYCNVLLIAFHSEHIAKLSDDLRPCLTWKRVLEAVNEGVGGDNTLPRYSFWYDQTARETLSCMLLDAIIAPYEKPQIKGRGGRRDLRRLRAWYSDLLGLKKNAAPDGGEVTRKLGECPPKMTSRRGIDGEIEQLKSLCELLRIGCGSARDEARKIVNAEREMEGKPALEGEVLKRKAEDRVRSGKIALPPNANLYVCWYSHLRELIEREPSLAEKLCVCALPGGGFRGDWYIGILKGSVSAELGREAIEKLCRKEEEYKRFARGVGLPVRTEFRDSGGYFAWPLARDDVRVARVFAIHEEATLRSDINNYTKIRSTLSMVAWQLSRSEGDYGDTIGRVVGDRLFEQLRMLAQKD
ncbi:hypothetical protein JW916_05250 [Candidatus Sumerlaeota bacterium]|nr:hypothetical protein [Candidatus Sumerlaeota bacterium]